MATRKARKTRARRTEFVVADYLKPLWPEAEAVPSALPGRDILNTPGVAVEVKARYGLDLPAWMKQAAKNAETGDLPILVVRLNGQGEQSVGEFAAVVRLEDMRQLLILRDTLNTL